jgi:uncharacterized membrane protein YdjX (TVP38/TMEM64 family)
MAFKSSRSSYVIAAIAVVAGAIIMYLAWSAYDHEAVMAWFQSLHPLPFFIAAVLLPTFGVPTTPIYLLAGAAFGAPLGIAISWSALVLNAALCFSIARWLRPVFARLLGKSKAQLPDYSARKGALKFVLGVKLAPGAPAFIKNYTLGMSRVPFRMFLVVAIVLTGLYAAAFVLLGESLLDHRPSRTVTAVAIIAGLVALGVWYRRRTKAPRP